jgi:vacuolar protein sorting-associated protein 13A/C
VLYSILAFCQSQSFYYFSVSSTISKEDVFDLKVTAELNAFNVFFCDQKCNIADIKIHGE